MKSRLVWSDEEGDLRKSKDNKSQANEVVESNLELKIRRLTSGKGRTIIEISGLPDNKLWCKKLTKELKTFLATGGAYKQNYIEIHGEKIDQIKSFLESKALKCKKIGG